MAGITAPRAAGVLWALCVVAAVPRHGAGQTPAAGAITGRIQNDSGRAVTGAEVVLAALGLHATAGAGGRFRLDRVPRGTHQLLIRAVGYVPLTVEAVVSGRGGRGTDLGVVTLRAGPALLPELEARAKIAPPTFGTGPLRFNLDSDSMCRDCSRSGLYAPGGASMTDDGRFAAIFVTNRGPPDAWVVFRGHPLKFAEFGPLVFGSVCSRSVKDPLAVRFDQEGQDVRVLERRGRVWVWKGIHYGCRQTIPLAFRGLPLGAAGWRGGWFVAVRDSLDRPVLRAFNDFGREIWHYALTTVFGAETRIDGLTLAATPSGVTVAVAGPPFPWAEFDSTGKVLHVTSALSRDDLTAERSPKGFQGWRAYAVLPIPNGFIQTLENASGADGFFMLYDVAGRPVQALGRLWVSVLIASIPEHRMALGYRYRSGRHGSSQLIFYYY